MFRIAASTGFLMVFLSTAVVFPDGSVVQSGSPTFPLQVDRLSLRVIRAAAAKKPDTASIPLPVSLYADLRDNLDTIFTYADALRKRRPELAGNPSGPSLTIEYMGLCVMRIFFLNNSYKSGKLIASVDRYPFVVVLTRGFSARMKKLAGKK
jgi:hypothetical protein